MKVLIINWQDIKNPYGGGAEVHLHEIFKRMVRDGNCVTLLCCRFEGCADEEVIDGIRVIRRGSRNFFNFTVMRQYAKNFKKEDYDIIIDDINKIPFFTPLYIKDKPLLAISHHFFGRSIFREADFFSALYVYFAEMLVNIVYKHTPFVVVSNSTLQEFSERGFDTSNFSIIHNAIDQSSFPMAIYPKSPQPIITYFGRLKKYKSPDHLLRAFAIIARKHSNAKLHILGRGDFRQGLEKLARELGIAAQTVFFGYISEADKVKLLGESWCVVNTSMKEGWGITNIEANACGTPVVSANVPGLRDSVSDGVSGALYEYGNIKELADRLSDLIENAELRERLFQGSVNWAKGFSWDYSSQLMYKKCQDVRVMKNSEVSKKLHIENKF